MRRSQYLLHTVKENPKEAVVISHILMVRSGMIKQLASGIYNYLPVGLRVLRNIETIVREELNAAGCQELLMPFVQPAELWEESGRWQAYGKELLRIKDRKNNDYCLGPTHEEVITDIVRHQVRSYKELPLNIYQIQTKFRDEIRPRFGLMRGREFLMKDGYSFDADDAAADETYWRMHKAYTAIFTRCGLEFRAVEADSGAIGGNVNHEFHVLAHSGEDEILSSTATDYAANVERAEVRPLPAADVSGLGDLQPQEVATPNRKTIEEVAEFLGVEPATCLKMLVYQNDEGKLFAALIQGHRKLNEVQFRKIVGETELFPCEDPALFAKHGLTPGYMGPLGWPKDVPLVADRDIFSLTNAVVGGNKEGYHITGVVPGIQLKGLPVDQLRQAEEGDACPRSEDGVLQSHRGIEVGHIFKLGTKYSESMQATFLDQQGKDIPMVMGCYGIGVSRVASAAIEQNHDEHGIIWPVQIAPFQVNLLNLDVKDDTVSETVETLYTELQKQRIEVLLDDLPQRPGFKFKDADLIGIPLHLIVGARSLQKGVVELKDRRSGEKSAIPVAEVVDVVLKRLQDMGWQSR
jgi:prolyl-tRNA synthetase